MKINVFRHIVIYLLVVVLMAAICKSIEFYFTINFISSYPFLFGYAFFIFAKTHFLVNWLSKKLDTMIGQLYLGFSIYKLIFSFFYFMILKVKTEYYDKPFLGVFMIIYFTLLIIEFIQYKKILQFENN